MNGERNVSRGKLFLFVAIQIQKLVKTLCLGVTKISLILESLDDRRGGVFSVSLNSKFKVKQKEAKLFVSNPNIGTFQALPCWHSKTCSYSEQHFVHTLQSGLFEFN